VAVQLDVPVDRLLAYASQQVTFSHHKLVAARVISH
jgi:hypothetical protein